MQHWRERWGDRWDRAERWFLPSACLGCHRSIEAGDRSLVCALCRARWPTPPHPRCPRCGTPGTARTCRICGDWPDDLLSVQSAVMMDDGVRQLIHHFKYRGWPGLARDLARPLLPLLAALPTGAIVPIPSGPRRRRWRGYNPAELLARAATRDARRPLALGVLRRVHQPRSQTRLGMASRRANLAGAFAAADRVPERVILVDDVFTTGATLVSAATALFERGTLEVVAVTFARAEPPLAAAARLLTTDSSTSERD